VFDLRYHAISLVAVFLALGLGILLGITIGDSLISEADRGLRESLRRDVVDAKAEEQLATRGLELREELIGQLAPDLVSGTLRGRSVAIVGVGRLPEGLESEARDAIEAAGGRVDSVTVLPAQPGDIAQAAGVSGNRPDVAAAAVTRAVVEGRRAAERLRQRLSDRFMGDYGGADAVVFHGVSLGEEPPETAQAWEAAVIESLKSDGARVVGVEQSGPAEDSQVPFYADSGIASVDNVDSAAGRVALAYALAGATGRFGFKESAEQVLPGRPRAVR
jgi:copper transport outer membrane protein MctB